MKQVLILRGQVKVEKEIIKERQNPLMMPYRVNAERCEPPISLDSMVGMTKISFAATENWNSTSLQEG